MGKKYGYKFTSRRHSKKAIMSAILGCISLVSMILAVYLSYRGKGQSVGSTGVTGICITLFSVTGLILGIGTLMEKDRYKLFPVVGTVLNALVLIGMSMILYAGTVLID